jgi:hypothetical protein
MRAGGRIHVSAAVPLAGAYTAVVVPVAAGAAAATSSRRCSPVQEQPA